MANKEVEWAMTLPIQLRGGPESETQKAVKEGRFEEPEQTAIIVMGEAAMPLSMDPEKLDCEYVGECKGDHSKCKGGDIMKHYCKGGRVKMFKGGTAGRPKYQLKGSFKAGGQASVDNIGAYEGASGGATGQSDPNVIQSNKVANVKSFDDHEGEFYASAPLVQILGGAKETEGILLKAARERIRGKSQAVPNLAPIMNKEDIGTKSPGSRMGGNVHRMEYRGGGMVNDYRMGGRVGYAEGDEVIKPTTPLPEAELPPMPTIQSNNQATPSPVTTPGLTPAPVNIPPAADTTFQMPTTADVAPTPVSSPVISPDAMLTQATNIGFKSAEDMQKAQGQSAESYYNEQLFAAARNAGFENNREMQEAQAAGQTSEQYYAARKPLRIEEQQARDLITRDLTPQEDAWIKTANNAQLADFLVAEGLMSQDDAKAAKNSFYLQNPDAVGADEFTAGPEGDAIPGTKYDATLDAALKMLESYAAGNNPAMDAIINKTMQQYGSDAAAGSEALKMDLANKGITGPAADAIIASYDRNSRIGENQLRGDFAVKVMEDAKAASGELLRTSINLQAADRGLKTAAEQQAYDRMTKEEQTSYDRMTKEEQTSYDRMTTEEQKTYLRGITERNYTDTQWNTQMTTALTAKNYGEYARLYKERYGVDLDMSNLTDAQASINISQGTADIMAAFKQDPEMQLNSEAGGVYLRPGAEKIWEAQHPGEEMPDAWANNFIDNLRLTNSPVYQMMNSLSEADALSLFFAGDQEAMSGFVNHSTGNTGWKGFKEALPSMFSIGGITRDEEGELDFDFGKIFDVFPELEIGVQGSATPSGGGAVVTGDTPGPDDTPAPGFTIGSSYDILNNSYDILSANADGSYQAYRDGKLWTINPGTDAGNWSPKESENDDGLGVSALQADDEGNIVTEGGKGVVTNNGQPVKVTADGKELFVFKVGDDYNTKSDGSGDPVNLDDPNKPIVSIKNRPGGQMYFEDGEADNQGGSGAMTYQFKSNVGEIGTDENGDWFVMNSEGKFRPYSILEAADEVSSDPNMVRLSAWGDRLNRMASQVANTGAFSAYKIDSGLNIKPSVVTAFIDAGDTSALDYASKNLISGGEGYRNNQKVIDAVYDGAGYGPVTTSKKSDWRGSFDGRSAYEISPMRWGGNNSNPPSIGTVFQMNGEPYKIEDKKDGWYTYESGKRYWYYKVQNLVTGAIDWAATITYV